MVVCVCVYVITRVSALAQWGGLLTGKKRLVSYFLFNLQPLTFNLQPSP